ncbi:MAG: DUF4349 domain-containing protein [Flavobacteriales bacterium]|nr:DUF4349 domain-containing protein [Flavobacteriales bacterium]
MKKYIVIIITVISILFYSCSENESYISADLASNFTAEAKSEIYGAGEEIEGNGDSKDIDIPARSIKKFERKLIKEGSIVFKTDDCKKTKKMIHQVANSLNGYLARDDENSYDHQIEYKITIRVPSENFDNLLTKISKSVNKLDDQNISVRDVTEEYVDIDARVKAKKIVEKRYLELLSKAHSIEEILLVEHELARLREQIESKEGRLRYLKDQVSLSTLNITFYQTIEVEEENFEFFNKIGNGFHNGFEGLLWIFIGLVNIWPFLMFVCLGILVLIRFIKKTTRKKN